MRRGDSQSGVTTTNADVAIDRKNKVMQVFLTLQTKEEEKRPGGRRDMKPTAPSAPPVAAPLNTPAKDSNREQNQHRGAFVSTHSHRTEGSCFSFISAAGAQL